MFKLRKLEDRIVLDGALVDDLLDGLEEQQAYDDDIYDGDDPGNTDDPGIDVDMPLAAAEAAGRPSDDNGIHVLVVSAAIDDAEDLANAAKDNVRVVMYDASEHDFDLNGLTGLIEKVLGDEKADSIAFANQIDLPAQIDLVPGNGSFTADSVATDPVQQTFLRNVGSMIAEGGRIDLLACNVVDHQDGEQFLESLEKATGVNVAASTDATGNEAYGGDWVLESDDIDIASTYFDSDLLRDFEGHLGKPIYNGLLPAMIEVQQGAYNVGDVIYTIDPNTWTDVTSPENLFYGYNDAPGWLRFDSANLEFELAREIKESEVDIISDVRIAAMDGNDFKIDERVVKFNAVGANDPPQITAGDAVNYTEGDPAVVLDSTIDVFDPDTGDNIQQAAVTISAGYQAGQDVLAFGGSGLNAFWNTTSGSLLLTGTDTVGNYAAALETVTYVNTSGNPAPGTRTISWVVNDGATDSAAATSTVTVTSTASAPEITAGGSLNYTENGPASAVDNAIQVADADSDITAATVAFGPNYVPGEDVLAYPGSLTSSWDSTNGIMTITGVDSPANYEAALASITYVNTSDNPSPAARTITWTVSDGALSASGQSTINVTPVNDPPVVTAGSTTPYSEGDGTVVVESALGLTDAENDTITGAIVEITGGYASGEDFLDVPNVGAISGNFSNGILTLTGNDSVANYRAALQQVTFENTSANPTDGVRTITWTVDDGTADSIAVTSQVDLGGVNDPPAISGGSTTAFTEDGGAVVIDGTVAISDPENDDISAATVSFNAGFKAGEDVLGYAGALNSAYNSSTGVLTLTGIDTIANYEAALRSITYDNTSDMPSTSIRWVSMQIADDGGLLNTVADPLSKITVKPVNDLPVITADGSATYNEGDPPVVIDASVLVDDPDNTKLRNAYVQITGAYQPDEDRLRFTPSGGINGSFSSNTGILTLAGVADLAAYQTVLSSVAYENVDPVEPTQGLREITWWVKDNSNELSTTVTGQVDVVAGNNPPVITAGQTLAYTEGTGAVAIDNTLDVSDPLGTNLTAATVALTGNFVPGEDLLAYSGTLTSSWDSANGVLTLVGTESIANYDAALSSVTYENTSADPSTLTRQVTWTVSDGGLTGTATSAITVAPDNSAPVVSVSGTLDYTEGDGAVFLEGGIEVSDADSANLTSATIAFGANYVPGEDELAYTGGVLTSSWDIANGILTLTGLDTVANYDAALESVTYENLSGNPSTAQRTVTWTVSDDDAAVSAGKTTVINITSTNTAPVITSGNTLAYSEGDGTEYLDAGILVQDPDGDDLNAATLVFSANYETGFDVLDYAGANSNLTTLWNSFSGKLTLTGTDSAAAYQQALRNITFENSSGDPSTLTREVTLTVRDANLLGSATEMAKITITVDADPPAITAGDVLNYTENDGAVAIDSDMTVSDVDSADLQAATVAIGANFSAAEDRLGYTGSLASSYDTGTGVLTLTGADTVANYESALESVTYENISEDPTGGTREILWTVNDGTSDSATVSSTINVIPVNDAPVLTAGTGQAYTEGMGTMIVESGIAAYDAESDQIQGATVGISGVFMPGEDLLTYTGGVLTSSYDSNLGVLTLTGGDTVAAYQTALSNVAYENASADATPGVRTITWTINDGTTDSAAVTSTVNVIAVNDAPVVTAGNSFDYTENDGPVTIDSTINVADAESDNIQSATVSFASGFAGAEDVLSYAGILTPDWNAGSGVLRLTGSFDAATFADELKTVTYENTSDNPSTENRVILWEVSDGALAGTATTTIQLTAVNDAPDVSVTGTLDYTEASGPVLLDSAVLVTDVDSDVIKGATITITNYVAGEDVLAIPGDPNIVGQFDTSTGIMTLLGNTTEANYQAALQSVTYENLSAAPDTTPRTVTWVVTDGLDDSLAQTTTINIVAVNEAPAVTAGATQDYSEGAGTVAVDAGIDVTDVDGDDLVSATVALGGTFVPDEDRLAYTGGVLTPSYNTNTGVLTLSGTQSTAVYMAELASVTYENLDATAPTAGVRTVTWTVNDGEFDSAAATSEINVIAENTPPAVTADDVHTYTEGDGTLAVDDTLLVDDIDNTGLASARVTIGGYVAGEDVLAYDGATVTDTWDSVSGTLTLSGAASLADYQMALRAVTYENTDVTDPTPGQRTISFVVNDGVDDSTTVATAQIDVVAQNDPPVVTSGNTQDYSDNAGTVAVDPSLQVDDVDDDFLQNAYVMITGGSYVSAEDRLDYTSVSGITGTFNTNLGLLTFTANNSLANYELLLQGVTYENLGGANPTTGVRTIEFWVSDGEDDSAHVTSTINVIDANDAPVITVGDSQVYTEGSGAVYVDTSIAITDADNTELQGAVVKFSTGFAPAEDTLDWTNSTNITGSYLNGTLTLTGPAPISEYQGLLQGIQYENTSVDPTTGTRTIAFWVNDGVDDSNTAFADIDVVNVNSAPEITAGQTSTYTEGDGTATVDTTIAIDDIDNSALGSARVTIGGYVAGEDELAVTAGTLVSSWDSGNGVLTLTGTEAIANYEAALASLTYENTDATSPTAGIRTISYVVNDGTDDSAAATAQVTVIADNDPPVITAGNTTPYTEGDAATVIDANLEVADNDNTDLVSAKVWIDPADFTVGEDTLAYTQVANITGQYFSGSGQLLLTGIDSVANYQAALRSVTYENLNDIDPITGAQTIWFQVNDGATDSTTESSVINLVGANDAPIITSGAVLNFTESTSPATVDATPLFNITDFDSATMSGATVRFTAGFATGQDVLDVTLAPGINSGWDSAAGVLTLTGSSSVGNYITTLQSLTYENTSDDPSTVQRVIQFQVADDAGDPSNTVTAVINITAVNDAPVLTADNTVAYTEGDPPVVLDDAISITDSDDDEMFSARISVIGGTYVMGEDRLNFVSTASIGATWDSVNGVLTLQGTDTVANYQSALETVTYENLSDDPTTGTRTVEFIVNDGGLDSSNTGPAVVTATVDVAELNDPPIVTAGGVSYFTEGDPAITVDSAIDVFDPDNTQVQSATVAFGPNFQAGFDVIGAGANWDFDTNSGKLTLNGPQDVTTVRDDLRAMTYMNTSENPTEGQRILNIKLNDGTDDSVVRKETIWVTGVNDTPIVTAGSTLDYTEGSGAKVLDADIIISDDNTVLNSARVTIDPADYRMGEDKLAYIPAGLNVNATWDSANGVLTLIGDETPANYELALENVTYENLAGLSPSTHARSVTFVVNDGEYDSATDFLAPQEAVVNIVFTDNAPAITSANTVVYTEGGAAVTVDPAVDVTDYDTPEFTGATVEITGSPEADDRLAFDDAAFANISGIYNTNTNVLTLVGFDSVANYEAALQSVTFESLNANMGTNDRTITFTVDDGTTAVTATSVVQVQPVNDPPVLTGGGTADYIENAGTQVLDGLLTAEDPDGDDIVEATVKITAATYQPGEDVLLYTGAFTSTFNTTTGLLRITGTDSATSFADELQTVTYENLSDDPTTGLRNIKFQIKDDGGLWSNITTAEVNVIAENDPPLVTAGATQNYIEGDGAVAVDGGLTVADPDSMLQAATVAFTGGIYDAEEDVLAYTGGVLNSFWDSGTGVLRLTGTDTVANYEAALASVTYENVDATSPTTGVRMIQFVVNDGEYDSTNSLVATATVNVIPDNSPPEVTSGAAAVWTEGGPAIQLDPAITVSDVDDENLVAATVAFTAGSFPEDGFNFIDTAKITGTTAAGTLTLTGTDTVANYQAALASVTYANANGDNVTGGIREITFTVMDDDASVGADTMSLTVVAENDAPLLTAGDGNAYLEGANPTVLLDPGAALTVSDIDDVNLNSARVTIIDSYVPGEDYLDVATSANYIKSFDTGSATLTLLGTDTVANYQAALRTVVYGNNGGDDPTSGPRIVQFVVNDGEADSAGALTTAQVVVIADNDPPIITAGHTLDYSEGDGAVPIDIALDVTDPDSVLTGATVAFDAGTYSMGEDYFRFTNTTNITGQWNSVAGVMRLSGTDSVENYEAALRSVAYENVSNDPSTAQRTVIYTVADDATTPLTDTASSVINIIATNDPPILTASNTVDYVEVAGTGSMSTMLLDPALGLTDLDDATITGGSATVEFSMGFVPGEDQLGVNTAGALTIAYDTSTGKLTLTGTDSLGDWRSALQSVWYGNWVDTATEFGDDPTSGQRMVTFTVNDGGANNTGLYDTVAINVTPTNDPPEMNTAALTTDYTENDPPTVIDNAIDLTERDDDYLQSAVISITNYESAEDQLGFTDMNGITGTWDALTGKLTLTGQSLVSDYDAALESITYENLSDDPTTGARTISYTLNDGEDNSAAVTRAVNVNAVDDPPVVTAGETMHWTEGDGPQIVDATIQIDDPDNSSLAGATVSFVAAGTAGFAVGDILDATNFNYNTAIGDLNFTGTDASIANIEQRLQQMTYDNNTNDPGAGRILVITVNDGLNNGTANAYINITAVNDPPLVTAGTTQTYTEGGSATDATPTLAVDPALVLTDGDSANLTSARVTIDNYVPTEDRLDVTDTPKISSNFDTVNGILYLDGTDTVTNYQAQLRAIEYSNLNHGNPSTLTRTFTFVVNDGEDDSMGPVETATIDIQAVNDVPVVDSGPAGIDGYTATYIAEDPAVYLDPGILVTDLDDYLQQATITVTNWQAGDVLGYTGGFTHVWDSAGTLTLFGADNEANWQAALQSVTFENTLGDPNTVQRVINWTVNDGVTDSNTATSLVDVLSPNDPPIVTAGVTTAYTENDAAVVIDNTLEVMDPEGDNISEAQIRIVGYDPAVGGTLGINSPLGLGTAFDTATGILTLTGSNSPAFYQAAMQTITYENQNDAPPASETIEYIVSDDQTANSTSVPVTSVVTITPVNDGPVALDEVMNVDEDAGNGTSVGAVDATDPEGDAITYTILSGDTYGIFDIDPDTGVITVADNTNLDYETENLHVLQIGLEDDATPMGTSTATIAIKVGDVDETTSNYVVENAIDDVEHGKTLTWIYTVPDGTFTAPEAGHNIGYEASIGGGPLPGWLEFDESTKTFLYYTGTAPDATYSIDVTAVYTTDGGVEVDRVTDTFDLTIVASLDLEILDALQYLEGDGAVDGLPADGEAMIMVADADTGTAEGGENLGDILALLEMTEVDPDAEASAPARMTDGQVAAAPKPEEERPNQARV